jgi:cell division protein FtsL
MSRRKAKGRYWFGLWLGVFLLVATAVISRQKAALETASRLRQLRERRGALEAAKAELDRRIRVGSTAEALLPKVAKAGLILPADTSSTILVVDSGNSNRVLDR